ncbi:rab-6.2 [Symbiodinium sp. CCMP2592]|nr:rab-6.2 [Symbiodinium sp. CCMP2592]
MLTPPSVHRSVVAQNASERRAVAAERREQALAAQLVQERARALECRRQQLQLAQRERETYLEQVRAFFDMASAVQGVHDKPVSLCHPSVGPGLHRAGKSCSSNERRPASVDKAAVTAVSKSQPGWSEVSTAAPSTVGEEDQVDLCTTPAEAEIGSRLSASLRAWLNRADDEADKESHLAVDSKIPEEMESSNSLQQLEVALAGEIRAAEERDPLDETLSSSEDDVPESRMPSSEMRNRALPCSKFDSATKPAHAQASANECDSSRPRCAVPTGQCAVAVCRTTDVERRRRLEAAPKQARKSQAKQPCRTPAPMTSLKALSSEEEALQKSLLRLDFEEMKRQFSGKEPLWRDAEVMRDTFKDDPDRENKLQASLQRLDGAFNALQDQVEVRLERERALAGCDKNPGKAPAPACQRRRPCSAVGRGRAVTRRRARSQPTVPIISCPPSSGSKGRASTSTTEVGQ